jgi:voltage-gated potassium channel
VAVSVLLDAHEWIGSTFPLAARLSGCYTGATADRKTVRDTVADLESTSGKRSWGGWTHSLYHVAMAVLALSVIWLVTLPDEQPNVHEANLAIWAVFTVDYFVRLALAKDRSRFFRENIPDLLAILPFDFLSQDSEFELARLFRLARFARLIRLMRAGIILWRASRHLRGVLATNGLGYVLLLTTTLVVVGGVGIWIAEPEIGSVGDGIWWGLVTTTTIGYGDIAPKTLAGRAIAAVLMVFGIGTIGMMTGTIATYFIGVGQRQSEKRANPHVAHVASQLARWDELTPTERRQLAAVLAALAESSDETPADTPGGWALRK